MNKLIKEFNKKDSLIVISSYPDRNGEPAKQNAVACYAQNLMKAYKKRKVVILAEQTSDVGSLKPKKISKDGNLLIVRCWKPGSPLLYVQLTRALIDFNRAGNVLIQFEFNMLGSTILTSLLPAFIAFLRTFGKKVTVMQHQVVEDLVSLGGHLNVRKGSLKAKLLNMGLRIFYKGIGVFSNSIVVHEETLKEKLSRWVNIEKIKVISHGLSLDSIRGESKDTIRKGLGLEKEDFVLLIFGYIAWYKGVDWLINKVSKINTKYPQRRVRLIVAGGPSATLQSKKHYRAYLAKVEKEISNSNGIIKATGYVPEEEVYKYFKASDLVVLPYRTMMSASGPLSFALRFSKPYMVSEAILDSFKNSDVQYAIKTSGLDLSRINFSLKGNKFEHKLFSLMDGKIGKEFQLYISTLRQLRSWNNVVLEYEKAIYKDLNFVVRNTLNRFTSRLISRFILVRPNENL